MQTRDVSRFLSLEAVQYVLRQFLQFQLTPSIESHKYTVLMKLKVNEWGRMTRGQLTWVQMSHLRITCGDVWGRAVWCLTQGGCCIESS